MLVQALIDPVCFLTCYPQLLYNFVYRVPKLVDVLGSLTGMLGAARFLFSRDLIIAEVGAMSSPCVVESLILHECHNPTTRVNMYGLASVQTTCLIHGHIEATALSLAASLAGHGFANSYLDT